MATLLSATDSDVRIRLSEARKHSGTDSGAKWAERQQKLWVGKPPASITSFGRIDGVTAVMMLAPPALRTWGRRMYSNIAGDAEVCSALLPLPPSSYHVTLHGLEWLMHSDKVCTTKRLRLAEEALKNAIPGRVKFTVGAQNEGDAATCEASFVRLAAADDGTESALRAAEAACKTAPLDGAEADVAPPEALQFWHLTFGYWREGVPAETRARVHARIQEWFAALAGELQTLECCRPMVCTYRSMAAFEPLFVPVTSPELVNGIESAGSLMPQKSLPVPLENKLALGTTCAIPPYEFDAPAQLPGRIVFFTGAGCMGKSTSAHAFVNFLDKMSKVGPDAANVPMKITAEGAKHAHPSAHLYKGDAFFEGAEALATPSVMFPGPSYAGTRFTPDVPPHIQDISDVYLKGLIRGARAGTGELPTFEETKPLLEAMCDDIRAEFARLGGTFAIPFGIGSRALRDVVRARLADLKPCFVVLQGSDELNVKWLVERAARNNEPLPEPVQPRTKGFEPAGADEPDALAVELTEDGPTPQAIAAKVFSAFMR